MRSILYSLTGIIILFSVFQNCGTTTHESQHHESTMGYAFQYPYSEKPHFYTDTHLYSATAKGQVLDHFKIVTHIAYPKDSQSTIEYYISTKNPEGETICPSQEGHLTAGKSQIIINCVSPKKVSNLVINVLAVAGQDVQNFTVKF